MSFLNKTYILDKNENFEEFLESFGVSGEELKEQVNFKPSQILKKEGDQYILTQTAPGNGKKELKFKDGVEFDEEVAPGMFGKSIVAVKGNVFTQNLDLGDGLTIIYRLEFSDDTLVAVHTSSKWDGTARRYFKAA